MCGELRVIEAVSQYRLAKAWGIAADVAGDAIYGDFISDVGNNYRCLFDSDNVDSMYTEQVHGALTYEARLARLDLVYYLLQQERNEKTQEECLKECLDLQKGKAHALVQKRRQDIETAYKEHLAKMHADRIAFAEAWDEAETKDETDESREERKAMLSPWVLAALEASSDCDEELLGEWQKYNELLQQSGRQYTTNVIEIISFEHKEKAKEILEALKESGGEAERQLFAKVQTKFQQQGPGGKKNKGLKGGRDQLFAAWDKDPGVKEGVLERTTESIKALDNVSALSKVALDAAVKSRDGERKQLWNECHTLCSNFSGDYSSTLWGLAPDAPELQPVQWLESSLIEPIAICEGYRFEHSLCRSDDADSFRKIKQISLPNANASAAEEQESTNLLLVCHGTEEAPLMRVAVTCDTTTLGIVAHGTALMHAHNESKIRRDSVTYKSKKALNALTAATAQTAESHEQEMLEKMKSAEETVHAAVSSCEEVVGEAKVFALFDRHGHEVTSADRLQELAQHAEIVMLRDETEANLPADKKAKGKNKAKRKDASKVQHSL